MSHTVLARTPAGAVLALITAAVLSTSCSKTDTPPSNATPSSTAVAPSSSVASTTASSARSTGTTASSSGSSQPTVAPSTGDGSTPKIVSFEVKCT